MDESYLKCHRSKFNVVIFYALCSCFVSVTEVLQLFV